MFWQQLLTASFKSNMHNTQIQEHTWYYACQLFSIPKWNYWSLTSFWRKKKKKKKKTTAKALLADYARLHVPGHTFRDTHRCKLLMRSPLLWPALLWMKNKTSMKFKLFNIFTPLSLFCCQSSTLVKSKSPSSSLHLLFVCPLGQASTMTRASESRAQVQLVAFNPKSELSCRLHQSTANQGLWKPYSAMG